MTAIPRTFAQKALARAAGLDERRSRPGGRRPPRPGALARQHRRDPPDLAALRTRARRHSRAHGDHARSRGAGAHATPRAEPRRGPPLRRRAGHRALLRGRTRHLSSGVLGGGAARAGSAHPRLGQPHAALRLDGRVRRRRRAKRDGGDLGHRRALAAGAGVVAHRAARHAAALGEREGRRASHHRRAGRGRRALRVGRDRGRGGRRLLAREPHGARQHDGGDGRQDLVPRARRRGLSLSRRATVASVGAGRRRRRAEPHPRSTPRRRGCAPARSFPTPALPTPPSIGSICRASRSPSRARIGSIRPSTSTTSARSTSTRRSSAPAPTGASRTSRSPTASSRAVASPPGPDC